MYVLLHFYICGVMNGPLYNTQSFRDIQARVCINAATSPVLIWALLGCELRCIVMYNYLQLCSGEYSVLSHVPHEE